MKRQPTSLLLSTFFGVFFLLGSQQAIAAELLDITPGGDIDFGTIAIPVKPTTVVTKSFNIINVSKEAIDVQVELQDSNHPNIFLLTRPVNITLDPNLGGIVFVDLNVSQFNAALEAGQREGKLIIKTKPHTQPNFQQQEIVVKAFIAHTFVPGGGCNFVSLNESGTSSFLALLSSITFFLGLYVWSRRKTSTVASL